MTSNGHERARPLRTGDPQSLGDYRILGRLGRGGMGTVYLAKDASDRHVAVKLIHPDLTDDDAFRLRFAREVQSARRVARFSTAGVLDARLDGDPLFIVSEYVPGPNLAEAIQDDGPMDGGTLESLAMGVAAALTAIHRAGVIHRDLKPANVLLSTVGPKVIDFGIARAMDDEHNVTRSSQLMGTPAYLAPELIIGEPITPASDIFSWGCLVAFAGTGVAPFDAPTVPAVLHQISSAPPNLEGLDPTLRELVITALDKDPTARPSAQQLLNRLVGQEDPSEDVVGHTLVRSWTPPSTARPAPDTGASPGFAGAAAGGAATGAHAADVPAQTWSGAPQFAPTRPYDAAQPPPPQAGSALSSTPPSTPMPPSGPQQAYQDPVSGPQAGAASGPQYTAPYTAPYRAPGGAPAGDHPARYPAGPHPGSTGYPSGPQQPGYGPPQYGPPSGPQAGGPYGPHSGPQQSAQYPGHESHLQGRGQQPPPFGRPGHDHGADAEGGSGGGNRGTGASADGGGSGRRGRAKFYGAGAAALVLVAATVFGGVVYFGDPEFDEGEEVYSQDFARVESGWTNNSYGEGEEFDDTTPVGHVDEGFSIRATEDEADVQTYAPNTETTPPYAGVAADLIFKSGPEYASAGLFCLSSSQEVEYKRQYTQYEVMVRKDGESALIRRSNGTNGQDLGKAASVPGFQPKKQNRIQITCRPDSEAKSTTVRLWVNDEFVLEAVDTSAKRISKGETGVIARRASGGSGGDLIAHFDNYRIGDLTAAE